MILIGHSLLRDCRLHIHFAEDRAISIDPPAVGLTCAESKTVRSTALPFTADFFDDGQGD